MAHSLGPGQIMDMKMDVIPYPMLRNRTLHTIMHVSTAHLAGVPDDYHLADGRAAHPDPDPNYHNDPDPEP